MQADVILKETPPWVPPLRGTRVGGSGVPPSPLVRPCQNYRFLTMHNRLFYTYLLSIAFS